MTCSGTFRAERLADQARRPISGSIGSIGSIGTARAHTKTEA
jgi:hypothetical protein